MRPVVDTFHKLIGRPVPDILDTAWEQWEVSPATIGYAAPAIALPHQDERIKAAVFASVDETIRAFRGDYERYEGPTVAFRLTDVDLVDGVLFSRAGRRTLGPDGRRLLPYAPPSDVMSGSIYETWVGNRWFGSWLQEDCLTYRLAEAAGQPVTSMPPGKWHKPVYEACLGMNPRRVGNIHFRELIMFADGPNNEGKTARANDMRRRLLAHRQLEPVAGVFLLRGVSGDKRMLVNERDLAERAADRYGFRIVDIATASFDEIVAACGMARMIVGVEGSQLVHGAVLTPQDAAILVIQPPHRVCATLKVLTDRRGQVFAYAVAEGGVEEFRLDWSDLERTIDLALAALVDRTSWASAVSSAELN